MTRQRLSTVVTAVQATGKLHHGHMTAKQKRSKIYDAQAKVYVHIGGATGLYSGDWNRKSDP